jgi:hypothetical protein
MSFIDFTKTRRRLPERTDVWDVLQTWDRYRDPEKPILVVELVRKLQNQITPAALLDAINEMVNDGVLERGYRVVDPSMGTLLPDVYNERNKIPATVMNNWDRPVEVEPDKVRVVLCPTNELTDPQTQR